MLGAIAGAIAEAHYRMIPAPILQRIPKKLSKALWRTASEFTRRFGIGEVVEQLDSIGAG